MMLSLKKRGRILVILTSVLMLFLLRPYFVWGFALNKYINFLVSGILGLIFYSQIEINKSKSLQLLAAYFIALVTIYSFKNGANIIGFVTTLFVVFVPFVRDSFRKDVYETFSTVFVILVGISLLIWGGVILGVVSPIGTITPIDSTKDITYIVYPFCVTQGLDFRFYGPFDEPGVVGTLCGMLLFCERHNLKSYKAILLILYGLFSLSMFFYLVLLVILIMNSLFENHYRHPSVIFLTLFIILFLSTNNNSFMYDTIWRRLEWDWEEMSFKGDDRMSEDADFYFQQIKGTSAFWFGVSDKAAYLENVEGSSSYKNVIATHGAILFGAYVLFFILYGLKYRQTNTAYILYLFVMLGTIYQRPSLFSFVWLFLFTYMARDKYSENL